MRRSLLEKGVNGGVVKWRAGLRLLIAAAKRIDDEHVLRDGDGPWGRLWRLDLGCWSQRRRICLGGWGMCLLDRYTRVLVDWGDGWGTLWDGRLSRCSMWLLAGYTRVLVKRGGDWANLWNGRPSC